MLINYFQATGIVAKNRKKELDMSINPSLLAFEQNFLSKS